MCINIYGSKIIARELRGQKVLPHNVIGKEKEKKSILTSSRTVADSYMAAVSSKLESDFLKKHPAGLGSSEFRAHTPVGHMCGGGRPSCP